MTQEQSLDAIEEKINKAAEPNEPEEEGGEPEAKTVREVLDILGAVQDCSLCKSVEHCGLCVATAGLRSLDGPCVNASRARLHLRAGACTIKEALDVWRASLACCRTRLGGKNERSGQKD